MPVTNARCRPATIRPSATGARGATRSDCCYDALRRPTHLFVREPGSARGRSAEYTIYGEAQPQATQGSLVGRVHRRYDQAGLSQADSHDLGGHLTSGARRVLVLPQTVDWTPLDGQPLSVLDATRRAPSTPRPSPLARPSTPSVARLTQELPDGTVLELDLRRRWAAHRHRGPVRRAGSRGPRWCRRRLRRPPAPHRGRLRLRRHEPLRVRRRFRSAWSRSRPRGRHAVAGSELHLRPGRQRRADRRPGAVRRSSSPAPWSSPDPHLRATTPSIAWCWPEAANTRASSASPTPCRPDDPSGAPPQ